MMPVTNKIGGVIMFGAVTARANARTIERHPIHLSSEIGLQRVIEELMPKLRLAVIFGGNKSTAGSVVYQSQNTRSWKSYETVAEDIAASLRKIGFRHVEVMAEDMQLSERLSRSGTHMAWLNSGGVQGHNSAAHAPGMLEMLGLPYVGHDPLSATTLDNKHAFKREAVCAGLPTAPFATWNMARGPFRHELNSRFRLAFGDYSGPFIVKPVSGRASLHVHVVPDLETLPAVVADVFAETGNLVLIEKYLPGREFCISVAGQVTSVEGTIRRSQEPFAFGALERVLAKDELIFTSMDSKPITTSRFKDVDSLETELWENIHQLAREVFLEFNLGSLIRLDLRADESGKLHILEANPKPDLKRPSEAVTSLVSAGLSQTELGYDDLILSLLADRVDFLLRNRRGAMAHVAGLISPAAMELLDDHQQAQDSATLMVHSLNSVARRMRRT
jgi:D-alanine-D-alanine ligase